MTLLDGAVFLFVTSASVLLYRVCCPERPDEYHRYHFIFVRPAPLAAPYATNITCPPSYFRVVQPNIFSRVHSTPALVLQALASAEFVAESCPCLK